MHLNGRVWNLGKEASVQQPPESEALLLCLQHALPEPPTKSLDPSKTLVSFVEHTSGKVLVGYCVQNEVRPRSDHSLVLTVETPRRRGTPYAGIFLISIEKL